MREKKVWCSPIINFSHVTMFVIVKLSLLIFFALTFGIISLFLYFISLLIVIALPNITIAITRERETTKYRKEAMNICKCTTPIQSKEAKSDNFRYCKVGSVISKLRATERSQIVLSQFRKNSHFEWGTNNIFVFVLCYIFLQTAKDLFTPISNFLITYFLKKLYLKLAKSLVLLYIWFSISFTLG